MKTQKHRNFNTLIKLNFSKPFLVSFGIIWKNLTLTGAIWAQFRSDALTMITGQEWRI
jgi:hypothetical protein